MYNISIGLIGWKGSRKSRDDNPTKCLSSKESVQIKSTEQLKDHCSKFGCKVVDEKKKTKFTLIDLGIAVYDDVKEKEALLSKANKEKRKREKASSMSPTPSPKKKKKKKYVFKAPETLVVNILEPVEYNAKKEETRTGSVHPLGKVKIEFKKKFASSSEDDSDDSALNDEMMRGLKDMENDDEDDFVQDHFYECFRHILGNEITKNKNNRYKKYERKIGKLVSKNTILFSFVPIFIFYTVLTYLYSSQSSLYGVSVKNKLSMNKINNSVELLNLIKEVAKNGNNWAGEDTLSLRLAFGAKQKDDDHCTPNDFKSTGSLEEDELLFSQEEKHDARDKCDKKRDATATKQGPIMIENYLHRLYNDVSSPLYHGFLSEMKDEMANMLNFTIGSRLYKIVVEIGEFPPLESTLNMLLESTLRISNREFNGLIPKKDYFPPYAGISGPAEPPSLKQWGNTKNGKEYLSSRREDVLQPYISSSTSHPPSFIPFTNNGHGLLSTGQFPAPVPAQQSRIGVIEINTGAEVTKVKFCDGNIDEVGIGYVGTDINLLSIVKKGTGWKKYDKIKEERYFEIRRPNGQIFLTYKKEELKTYTLGEIINMMKLKEDETTFFINCGVRKRKEKETDLNDDLSL